MSPHPTPRSARDDIDLGRIFGLLADHKWLIVIVTFLFAVAGAVYVALATPIYQGDALVQVERSSSVSPLGDLSNVMGTGDTPESTTAAEVQILQSRMVLGQVVDRVELDTLVRPGRLPLVGGFVERHQIPRPAFLTGRVDLARWLPPSIGLPEFIQQSTAMPETLKGSVAVPDLFKSELSLPDFLQGRSLVWGGEVLRLGVFEVADHLRGRPLIVSAGEGGAYSLRLGETEPLELGIGRVGELHSFANGDIKLRLAELEAAEGAEFTLLKLTRSDAIKSLGARLSVSEIGGGRSSGTGILRLTLTGPDRDEIQRSLDAVAETFLAQNVQRQSAEAEKSLAFLEEQAPQLRDQLAAAEDSLNQYRTEQDSVDLTSEAQATIQQFIELESQLSELEFQEAELAERYTTNHPTYQSLLRQKRQLEERRAELNARVDALPAAQQEVVRRTRDVEVTQAIYVNVLNKMQELQVARAGTVGNVRIIDNALVAGAPIAPRKPMTLLLATLLGGLLSVGFVLVRGLLNRGVESPEQLDEVGLSVYATVPLSDEQKQLEKRIKRRRDRSASQVISGVLADWAPADTSIEALRGLRTSLHFAMLDGSDNRLMITGPSPGIGKSFIAINLGAVCAQAGQKVLVVDADLRKGHLHHAFKGQSEGGLSELLCGQLTLDEAIRHSQIEGLDYVARGIAPPNPSELLMTAGFSGFLEAVGQRYDLVILDTPPVLAVTDAAVVGKQCGTMLLVARFQVNPLRELLIAERRLENSGVTVKGVILNAMERKAATSYSYGYYQYAYK